MEVTSACVLYEWINGWSCCRKAGWLSPSHGAMLHWECSYISPINRNNIGAGPPIIDIKKSTDNQLFAASVWVLSYVSITFQFSLWREIRHGYVATSRKRKCSGSVACQHLISCQGLLSAGASTLGYALFCCAQHRLCFSKFLSAADAAYERSFALSQRYLYRNRKSA